MAADRDRATAEALSAALRELGVLGDVEVRDRLAVLVPATDADLGALLDDATRRQAVAAAKREGFTNLALEIRPATRATLPRD